MSKRNRLLLGLLLSSGMSLLAYRRRSLSKSGVAGAITTGTMTFGMGGLSWSLSLVYFFVSSSLFSHYRARDKAQTAADKFSKGGQRDIAQVVANGGVATLMAILQYPLTDRGNEEKQTSLPASPDASNSNGTTSNMSSGFVIGHSLTSPLFLRKMLEAGYVGALATATADTWATELGVLSTRAPRLITTGKVTLPGTSGGITPLGTAAAASGAFSLGLVFRLLNGRRTSWALLPIALLSGLVGSLFDSWLGATCQAMYYCPACQKETERRIHSCGKPTQPLRGLVWMDNDVVNFLATLVGSLFAILLHLPIQRRSRYRL